MPVMPPMLELTAPPRLRETEQFSDYKVVCGPYQFNLHKAVLSSQSEYFRVALKSGTFKLPLAISELADYVLTYGRRENAGSSSSRQKKPTLMTMTPAMTRKSSS
jgi:hypothetical protein